MTYSKDFKPYKTPSGKVSLSLDRNSLVARYSWQGKQQKCYFETFSKETYENAIRKANIIEQDLILGVYDETKAKYNPNKYGASLRAVKNEPTLLEVWDKYKEAKQHSVAHSTKKRDWERVDNVLAKLSQKAIKHDEVSLLISEMLQHYSAGTLKNVCIAISAASSLAYERKLIEANHWINLKKFLPVIPENERAHQAFTASEVNAILEAFSSNAYMNKKTRVEDSHYFNFVAMLARTGMRPSECMALTYGDIFTKGDKQYIRINKAYVVRELKHETKTGEIRLFPVNNQVAEILARLPKSDDKNAIMFPSHLGKYIDLFRFTYSRWQRVVNGLVEDGKVEKYLPLYHLRHSYITSLVEKQKNLSQVAAWVGTSVEMLSQTYLGHSDSVMPPEI